LSTAFQFSSKTSTLIWRDEIRLGPAAAAAGAPAAASTRDHRQNEAERQRANGDGREPGAGLRRESTVQARFPPPRPRA
jgi:hypothetical protein